MTIRPAVPSDEAVIFALATRLSPAFTVERAAFDATFAAMIDDPTIYLHVAERSHVTVGYLLGWARPSFYANGPVAWLQEIVVQPAERRSGAGRQLMAHFEAWAITGAAV